MAEFIPDILESFPPQKIKNNPFKITSTTGGIGKESKAYCRMTH
jgi:hypothetical protein